VSEENVSTSTVQAAQPVKEVSNPLHAEDTTTLDYAASRLQREPSKEPAPIEEPEETAELEEEEQAEESESQTSDDDEGEVQEEQEDEEYQELEYYTIKADGEEIEVTLDELQSGYQRQKDYTKKTQAIAEQRKAYEAQTAELAQLQQTYLTQVTLANEVLNRDLKAFETVDWNDLKVNDPIGYLQKQIELQDVRSKQAELQQQAQSAFEHNQKVKALESEQHLEAERKKVLSMFPEWKDETKAAKGQKEIADYARALGYSDEVLSSITNATDIQLLDKARKWDALQSTKQGLDKKKTAPAIRKKVKTQGAAPKGLSKAKHLAETQGRFRQSGSLKDAAAFMHELRTQKEIRKSR